MTAAIIIPARMASTRLPRKPLADILGKSMIERVYKRCKAAKYADEVIIATDHDEILLHAQRFGARAVMTSPLHTSGTDRIGEAALMTDADIIVNVQGDEPLIDPGQIDELIEKFENPEVNIATQKIKMGAEDPLFDYNVVKVVTDLQHRALYFSRQAIPAFRDLPFREWASQTDYYRHVGIYAFRSPTLQALVKLSPTGLERAESLEQLRWLAHGYTIHCFETAFQSQSVDTAEDLEKVIQILLTEMNH